MGGENKLVVSLHLLLLCLFLFSSSVPCIAKADGSSSSFPKFTPPDNYLINFGSLENTVLDDGRTFKSDTQSASFLSTDENILTSINSIPTTVSSSPSSSHPFYLNARIFQDDSMYRFLVFKHWLRLYFYSLPHPTYNLTTAIFDVTTDSSVLFHRFSFNNNTALEFKEYLIDITSDGFSLKFSPMKDSFASINAIELVSAPDDLIPNSASSVSPIGDFHGLFNYALGVSYRLNMRGPIITPKNDTLSRTWLPDTQFMTRG